MSESTEEVDYYGYLNYISSMPKDNRKDDSDNVKLDLENNAAEIQLDKLSIYGDFSAPGVSDRISDEGGRDCIPMTAEPDTAFVSTSATESAKPEPVSAFTRELSFIDSKGRHFDPVTLKKAAPTEHTVKEYSFVDGLGQSFVPTSSNVMSSPGNKEHDGSVIGIGGMNREMKLLQDRLALLGKKDKQRAQQRSNSGESNHLTYTGLVPKISINSEVQTTISHKKRDSETTPQSDCNYCSPAAHEEDAKPLARALCESQPEKDSEKGVGIPAPVRVVADVFEDVDLSGGYESFMKEYTTVAESLKTNIRDETESTLLSPSRAESSPSTTEDFQVQVQGLQGRVISASDGSPASLRREVGGAARQDVNTRSKSDIQAQEDEDEEDASIDMTSAVETLKNIPVNIFYNPTDNAVVDTTVHLASEAARFVNQYAIKGTQDTLMGNYYTSSFIGCMNESFYFILDRARSAAHHYLDQLHSDDPEHVHLQRIKNSSHWHYLMLRYSMASLTWKQRQIIEETRENHEMTVSLFNSGHTPDCESLMGQKRDQLESMAGGQSVAAVAPNTNHSGQITASRRTPIEAFVESNIHSWLMNDASMGDEDAQYALARYFTAPAFANSKYCKVPICRARFSIGLFRHHCRFCGQSVCEAHSKQRRCIYRFGFTQPVRVCDACAFNIDEVHRRDQLLWRESRLRAYFNRRLLPYFNTTLDRGVDKMIRIAEGTFVVAKTSLYYSMPAQIILESISILRRYGLSGFAGLLLRKDFMESVETLKRISGMDKSLIMSLHELTACIYYKLAIDRGLRGCNPDSELIAHAPREFAEARDQSSIEANDPSSSDAKGCGDKERKRETDPESMDFECKPALDEDIDTAIRYAPLALKIVYENSNLDAQRLARSLGWDLIFSNVEDTPAPEQPVYMLFGTNGGGTSSNPKSGLKIKSTPVRTAVLAIRGTATIQDVVTDIRAAPAAFPPSIATISAALCGLPQFDLKTDKFDDNDTDSVTAEVTMSETVDDVCAASDVSPELSASANSRPDMHHSSVQDEQSMMGAGPKEWEWLVVSKNRRRSGKRPGLHTGDSDDAGCEGLDDDDELNVGAPKCSYACVGMIRSAMYILREVGPSLLQLHREGYAIKICGHSLGGCVSALLSYMLRRAELPSLDQVSSGRRNPFFNGQSTSSTLMVRSMSDELQQQPQHRTCSRGYCGVQHSAEYVESDMHISEHLNGIRAQAIAFGSPSCVDGELSDVLATKCGVINVILHDDVLCRITPASIRNLKKELSLFQKEVFHHMRQDFYDVLYRAAALWSPRQRQTHPGWFPSNPSTATEKVMTASVSRGDDDTSLSLPGNNANLPTGGKKFPPLPKLEKNSLDDEDIDGVLVEEEILPELWLPGKIIHIFFNRGQFHAAEVSRTFPDIRRIEIQGDIFKDHLSLNIFNALLEVRAVRQTHSATGSMTPTAASSSGPDTNEVSVSMPPYPPPPVPNKPSVLLPVASAVRTSSARSAASSGYVSEFDRATAAAMSGASSFRAAHSAAAWATAKPRAESSSGQAVFQQPAGSAMSKSAAPTLPKSTPPPWEPFDARDDCHCCGNSFTWHSTFQGDAQEYRERYNCRHCGRLVCGPCSTERRPIPKWGMIFPKRICDSCVNAGEFGSM